MWRLGRFFQISSSEAREAFFSGLVEPSNPVLRKRGWASHSAEADLSGALEASPTLKSEGHMRARQWLGQSAVFAVSYGG
jgi:hypothetical protein